ncbi:MAG: twin-arginine translocase TatA/TatE family subunit [Symploca sp. SIO2E9]|nr:twin-arginine translocase TatA/TatE family subunit [Symploca sp. SIO2E9]
MFGLGWPEVIVIAIIGLVIFGPKKIPEMGSALGKTLRGFKNEINNPTSEQEEQLIDSEKPAKTCSNCRNSKGQIMVTKNQVN